jgi:hypothetical protein
MVLDIWDFGTNCNEKEVVDLIKKIKIPPKNNDREFVVKNINISHVIDGSGFQSMSNDMCRALVLSPLNKKDLSKFTFKESNIQIIFPTFKPRDWSNDNDNLPPKWKYKVSVTHPIEDLDMEIYFYKDEILNIK